MSSRANEPAYPVVTVFLDKDRIERRSTHTGLSIREEFVRAAMVVVGPQIIRGENPGQTMDEIYVAIGVEARRLADATLAALEAGK